MTDIIRLEVFPVNSTSKYCMSSDKNLGDDVSLQNIPLSNGTTNLRFMVKWLEDPNHDGIPRVVSIKKIGEYFLSGRRYSPLSVYSAIVELPIEYFDSYKTSIDKMKDYKIRIPS